MKYAVEFNFDKKLSGKVTQLWEILLKEEIVFPQTKLRPYEPHISLLVFDEYVKSIQKKIESFNFDNVLSDISFDSFGIYKHDYSVLFLNPKFNFNIFAFHNNFFNHLKSDIGNIMDFTIPGKWNPHCTLVCNNDYKKIITALQILEQTVFPLKGYISYISLVNFKEGKIIYQKEIGVSNS
ncbi:MAG: 2'-5' RNA ligase family protein [Actinomycetia bacterium]|nr:2'-5' RNA ligase family protein [Actinomycetes bacterium]